ncbi:hypothetical protein ABZ352_18860 [Streptomyces griseofuscus]|uniref:hypothetical protein n=1 Tax=Streptomyces griseofuscus TaxID=146922 RepID=UPI0033C1B299
MTSIEVGVTRTPATQPGANPASITMPPLAPNAVITGAAHRSAAKETPVRLGPGFLADTDAVRQVIAHWTQAQVSALASVLLAESGKRRESQFVDVLRALFFVHPAEGAPVVRVEFVTNADYEDGVYWDEDTVYLHHADGTVAEFGDFTGPEDEDAEYAALDDMFRELLTDIAAEDRPQHGDHLIVDLATGQFEQTGRDCLV